MIFKEPIINTNYYFSIYILITICIIKKTKDATRKILKYNIEVANESLNRSKQMTTGLCYARSFLKSIDI